MRLAAVALSVAILVTYATASHALSGGPVDGQVLEYDTGKPVEGAMVVARWKGAIFALVESRSVCVHAEMAVSDKNGFFRIAPWTQSAPVDSANVVLYAYKPKYQFAHGPLAFVGAEGKWNVFRKDRPQEILQTYPDRESAVAATHPDNVYLKPFVGNASERLDFLSSTLLGNLLCNEARESNKNLYPVVKAAYQEAKPLATTVSDLKELAALRRAGTTLWRATSPDATIADYDEVPDEIKGDLE